METKDIVVVGGGVVGLTVAFRLVQSGRSVTLLERGVCGGEASWAGAGILSPPNAHRRDPIAMMQRDSIAKYPDFCAELKDLTGIDPEYENGGGIDFLTTDQFVRMAESDVRVVADGRNTDGKPLLEMLTQEQCCEVEPAVTGGALAYLHCRTTSQVRNPRLLKALVASCRQVGVTIREQVDIRRLLRDGDQVVGVQSDDEKFMSGRVVLCSGAWSSRVKEPELAESISVFPVRGQIVLVRMEPRPFVHTLTKRQAYLVPRRDGHVLIGATSEPEAGFDKRNTAKGVEWLIGEAVSMVPTLAEAPVITMWAGLRPGTADGRPFIGPVPGFAGLIAATGHYRTGLTMAPVTAEIVTDLINDGRSDYDLSRCMPGRAMGRANDA